MKAKYDYTAIRRLVGAAFDAEELEILCFDLFPEVKEKFASGQTKNARVVFLVDHAKRHGKIETLLREIKDRNPYQYGKFAEKVSMAVPEAAKTVRDGPPESGGFSVSARTVQGAIQAGSIGKVEQHFHTAPPERRDSGKKSPESRPIPDEETPAGGNAANILHLSDLHFGTAEDGKRWQGQLTDDLKLELNCRELDAAIISGDIANKSEPGEYDAARNFLESLSREFNLSPDRIVIVPGNHDLNWDISKKRGYRLVYREELENEPKPGDFIDVNDEIIQYRDQNRYKERFRHFRKLYRDIKGEAYPDEYADQGTLHYLPTLGILILGLNSAWEIDHHFKSRASINPDAVENALDRIRGRDEYRACLKFAVWHHPLTSPFDDRIRDHGFMERLAQCGFSVCFHGHVHKAETGLFQYDHSASGGRKIRIVGAGTFGAPVKDWYPGYPLQYNLIRIQGNRLTVETRRRNEINGAWKPDAIWTQGSGKDPLPRYSFDLPAAVEEIAPREKPPEKLVIVPKVTPVDSPETAIRSYLEKVASLHEKIPLSGFRTPLRVPIRVKDIYVPLGAMVDRRLVGKACFADAKDAEKRLAERDCGEEISIPDAFMEAEKTDRRGVVILGDPGSGKTTHLKRVLLWCAGGGFAELGLPEDAVPVFLPLRELTEADLNKSLDAFIQRQLDLPHLDTPEGFGRMLLDRGNLLFLLDGLDEVAETKHRSKISRYIETALAVHDTCRFVVTSRFAGYTEDARLNADFLEMHLRPMSADQAAAFIHNWYRIVETGTRSDPGQAEIIAGEKADKLIERLRQPEFRARRVFEMTRNPLLLTNLCLVHLDRGNLPHTRAALYEECIDVLLERWREAAGVSTRIRAKSGVRVLQPAALWMHGKENRTRAKAEELAPVIEPAIKAVGWEHGSGEEFLKAVRNDSGLLTGWGDGSYGFMHLGFQEYLAAREIRSRAYKDPDVLKTLAGRFGESWWREVTLLLLALEKPSHFEPFMREVVELPAFAEHPDLVEMCLDDSLEVWPGPFAELLEREPGNEKELWERQLLALRILERLDKAGFERISAGLRNHPYDRIRKRVGAKATEAIQKVEKAERGGYELVFIPGGVFMMGSPETEEGRWDDEGPQHEIRVPDFYMGRYPVTNEEYARFLAEHPDAGEPKFWGDSRYNQAGQPVVGVSWNDAQKYAEWAGLLLPTEPQWEYACRAGTKTRYYTGDTEEDLDRAGWYGGNSGYQLHPVGEKEPNRFGLYDMHGNVWEWTRSLWGDKGEPDFKYPYDPGDGREDMSSGADRVIRGGAWGHDARLCRSAYRGWRRPGSRGLSLGFRLARLPGH